LPRIEFVRRWCLHIQPSQLTKTRFFGGWSNTCREAYLERCAILLENEPSASAGDTHWPPPDEAAPDKATADGAQKESPLCPRCQERLRQTGEQRKPSWPKVLDENSPWCPAWYRPTQAAASRRWWDKRLGVGFSKWYEENILVAIESAKAPRPALFLLQLHFPGMAPIRDFVLESF
jgi:hypothetical protein